MAADRRTRLTPEERRKQLIALGVKALATRPLEEITIETLAEVAGVSRGLVFYYFGSKRGMHQELVKAAHDSMIRATEPRSELPPLERLHDTLVRLVHFVRTHRETFYSLVRGTAAGDEDVREVVDDIRLAQTERLHVVFTELGIEITELMALALRAWVSLAEQVLIDGALHGEMSEDELVGFLDRSLNGVMAAVAPSPALVR